MLLLLQKKLQVVSNTSSSQQYIGSIQWTQFSNGDNWKLEALCLIEPPLDRLKPLSVSPYLMTCDQKSCPNKKAWYCLGSGGHEENRLFWCGHWGFRYPGGVGSLWNHSGWGPRGKANWRVICHPLRQDYISPQNLMHLYEERV